MPREAETVLVSTYLLLVATSNSWTAPSTCALPSISRFPSSNLARLRALFQRRPPPTQTTSAVGGAHPEPSEKQQPERRRWEWRRLFRPKRPNVTEGETFDETKLERLPYFLNPRSTFGERVRYWLDRLRHPIRRRQVMADLYKRHAHDEMVYGITLPDDT